MRLLWKILLFSVLVAAVPLSFAGWKIIERVRDELLYVAVSGKLERIASDLAYRIDRTYAREWRNILQTLARTEQLALLGRPQPNDPVPPLEAAVEEQDDVVAILFYPDIDRGSVLTLRGALARRFQGDPAARARILDALGADDTRAREAARSHRGYIGHPFAVEGLSGLYLTVAIPWETPGATPGAVIAKISLARLQQDVQRAQFGRRGLVYVVDAAGKTVAHPDTGLVAQRADLKELPAVQAAAPILAARQAAEWDAAGTDVPPVSEGRQTGTGYALCQHVPWAVIVEEPLSDALAPVRDILRDLVLWLMVGLGMAVVGGLVLSRMIGRPIKLLADGARAVGEGNFDHRIELRSRDEFGELAHAFNQMAAKLRAYDELNVENLIREKTKSEAILHNIADGVIVTGTGDEILMVNAPAERWFATQEREAVGRPVAEATESADLAALIEETRADVGNAVHAREIAVTRAGQVRPTILNARAARVVTQRGELVAVTTALRDVTAEREVDRMKTELVSVVAHELRSPLVSIMGFSSILRDDGIDAGSRREFARIINEESNRMVEMINKFLDISRIESGRTEIVRVPSDLVELARQVVEINRGQADAKGMSVEVRGPERITPVLADPTLVGQALLNLFTNAVKYSPPETAIRVVVTEHRDDIEIAVSDEGYGISEAAQRRLFEKFYRVEDDPRVREVSGTGLGLSLVREILERHGGRVGVRSARDEGSTFSLFLPKRWT